MNTIYAGEFEGFAYEHRGILNVGWRPEKPAVHTKFNWKSINRVQAGDDDFQLKYWVDDFENNPSKKYISENDWHQTGL